MSAAENLALRLLAPGVRHNPQWRSGTYKINDLPGLLAELRDSPVGEYLPAAGEALPGETHPYTGAPDPRIVSQPSEGVITVEENIYSEAERLVHLGISLVYIDQKQRSNSFQIGADIYNHQDPQRLDSLYLFPDWYETGYEGHGWKPVSVSPQQLRTFADQLERHLGELKSQPDFHSWLEQYGDITSKETGITYHYNKQEGE